MPKVTINMPSELDDLTPSERATLNKAFKTRLQTVLRNHVFRAGDAIWNVNRVATEIIISRGERRRPSKKAAKKKAAKKK